MLIASNHAVSAWGEVGVAYSYNFGSCDNPNYVGATELQKRTCKRTIREGIKQGEGKGNDRAPNKSVTNVHASIESFRTQWRHSRQTDSYARSASPRAVCQSNKSTYDITLLVHYDRPLSKTSSPLRRLWVLDWSRPVQLT